MRTFVAVLVLALSLDALALPAVHSESKTDDDLTVTIRVQEKTILNDSKSWCEIRVQDPGVQVAWTSGDTLDIWVFEDDPVGDDEIWHKQIVIKSEKTIDQTFDCSSAFPPGDASGGLEIYGKAAAHKANCKWYNCLQDSPSTANIEVAIVDDDAKEPDDGMASAKNIGLGKTPDYICKDQDWMSFEVTTSSSVTFRALHNPAVGRLDVTLFGPSGAELVTGADENDATSIVDYVVPAGQFKVRVSPRSGNDYNFYDVSLTITSVECEPGAGENEPCGKCGQRSRTCGEDGKWSDWGACAGEGECSPGDKLSESCGKCGTKTRTCNASCSWVVGACEGEGVCTPGQKETQACTGGTKERVCGQDCQWNPWGDCVSTGCTEGATQDCYDGPAGTPGVGECKMGKKTCHSGQFGACEGQVLPKAEDCTNGKDDDCDGKTDKADKSDCPSQGVLGDPCGADSECETSMDCLMPPDYPLFKGGYCGKVGCKNDIECGSDGICGHAFGKDFCLKQCDVEPCRSGYVCARYGQFKACTPKCKSDDDCVDADTPKCGSTGVCEKASGAEIAPEPQPEPAPEPAPDAVAKDTTGAEPVMLDVRKDTGLPEGAVVITEESGGCAAASGAASLWFLLLPGLGLMPRRRR